MLKTLQASHRLNFKVVGQVVCILVMENFFFSLGSEKRTYVDNNEIPKELKNAIVSVEDRRFYKEGIGLDPIRIVGLS